MLFKAFFLHITHQVLCSLIAMFLFASVQLHLLPHMNVSGDLKTCNRYSKGRCMFCKTFLALYLCVYCSKALFSFFLDFHDFQFPVQITHYGFCWQAKNHQTLLSISYTKHFTSCAEETGRMFAAGTCSRRLCFLLNRHNFQHILDRITACQISNILV